MRCGTKHVKYELYYPWLLAYALQSSDDQNHMYTFDVFHRLSMQQSVYALVYLTIYAAHKIDHSR
ncbi:hypothetical protein Fmac_016629 [Flemingia macrophylla]|uniref:Uncharacterized protein n=1 Tax=Flemingia macrophylla TaxID=520843 RepID=A0ABD1MI58_9FABA